MRLLLSLAALSFTLFAANTAQEGKRWWSHIQALANDNMEGRNTGSPGHKKAAEFVAGEFERQRPSKSEDAGFGGRIRGSSGVAAEGDVRRNVDDGA